MISSRVAGRILVIGTTPDGRVHAVADEPTSMLARSVSEEEAVGRVGALMEIRFERQQTRIVLLRALAGIAERGWIESKRLDRNGHVLPCNAPNCGGLTLEAELGVRPNSVSGPDFHGWEVKQHGVTQLERPTSGVLTLMTPEPDGGDYKQIGVSKFIEKYGYDDRLNRKDRINFGGIYKLGRPVALTGLRLEILGFQRSAGKFDANGSVVLLNARDHVAASWSFATLLTIWTRKHAQAAFVPSVCRKVEMAEYRYGSCVHLGVGTDFVRFLGSMTDGCVYYDPGIKLERIGGRPVVKRRSQFRVNFRDLHGLYRAFDLTNTRLGWLPRLPSNLLPHALSAADSHPQLSRRCVHEKYWIGFSRRPLRRWARRQT